MFYGLSRNSTKTILYIFASFFLFTSLYAGEVACPGYLRAYYQVLPPGGEGSLAFTTVAFAYGPKEYSDKDEGRWWELSVIKNGKGGSRTLCKVRGLTSEKPLLAADKELLFHRYLLRVPRTLGNTASSKDSENSKPERTFSVFEYIDKHTGKALLPAWKDFKKFFIPRPVKNTGWTEGYPNTCAYLGQVLSLKSVVETGGWKRWRNVKRLVLDPELLIGTGRTVKDREGHRIPQEPRKNNYSFVRWNVSDYEAMVNAGMSIFGIAPGCGDFLRSLPVLDRAIVIPYGTFIVLESPAERKNPWDLWWIRELDPEGKNEASQRYDMLRRRVMKEVQKCFDADRSFDIVFDDGNPITGYRKVVRVNAD